MPEKERKVSIGAKNFVVQVAKGGGYLLHNYFFGEGITW